MAKKYYAVRVGKVPGIYQTWDECKKNVHGFPAAEYKSFMSMEEAKAYMGREAVQEINGKTGSGNMEDVMPDNDYAFVDGSFNIATGVYGYGGFLMHVGVRYELSGNGSDKEMASMRNVAGEILGSMAAVKKAIELGLKDISIFYDYAGIKAWAVGEWKRNKKGTIEYYNYITSVRDSINIRFVKVRGHSGVEGNEDVEESDGEFKVYGINYVPGSLIYHRMGEKVDIILYVTWDKGRKPIPKAEKLDFEFDREKIQPCAEDKFKITASPFLFCSKAKYLGDSSDMVLYNYYDLSKHQVIISLLDAETRKIVQMKRGQLSKPMVFEKLQPGIYYYAVEADGYSPYVSPYSLQVVAGGKKDGWEGAYVSMRETKEESEDEEFRVLVWAGDDYPLPNTKLKAYIEHPNELEEEKENFYKMATDENGFLFFEEDLMNGARPIERRYQLYWNRWMLLSYEDESRDSAVEVEVKDGLGIARLAER